MEGAITDYTTTSLTVNVDLTGGSGTLASWNIDITGQFGTSGYSGISGYSGYSGSGVSGYSGNAVSGIPQNSQVASYTLQLSDSGKHISITTGGVTVPNNIFTAGDTVVVFNNNTTTQIITQGINTTLRWAGTANTGNRNLISYGVATILCYAANTFVIGGAGIT